MATTASPTIEERVILTVRGGEVSSEQVSATVRDVAVDGRLALHVSDTFAGSGASIRPGSLVALDCCRDDGLWRMLSLVEMVRASPGGDTGPDLLVSPPHDPHRVDRRRFLRVRVSIPVRLAPAGASAAATSGVAFSLGAGGVAFTSDEVVGPGTEVAVAFEEPGLALACDAKVVWSDPVPAPGRGRAGAEFLGLSAEDEDRILRRVVLARHRRRPRHR